MPDQTDEEYIAGGTATRASEAIDSAIQEGKGGTEILSMLAGEGIRVYTSGEMAGDEAEPMEEEALMGEAPTEEPLMEEPPMEAGLEGSSMPYGGPEEPLSGEEGGMRDMRMAAVKYALDKDKENKEAATGA